MHEQGTLQCDAKNPTSIFNTNKQKKMSSIPFYLCLVVLLHVLVDVRASFAELAEQRQSSAELAQQRQMQDSRRDVVGNVAQRPPSLLQRDLPGFGRTPPVITGSQLSSLSPVVERPRPSLRGRLPLGDTGAPRSSTTFSSRSSAGTNGPPRWAMSSSISDGRPPDFGGGRSESASFRPGDSRMRTTGGGTSSSVGEQPPLSAFQSQSPPRQSLVRRPAGVQTIETIEDFIDAQRAEDAARRARDVSPILRDKPWTVHPDGSVEVR